MADPAVWITGTGTNKQLNFRLPTGGVGPQGPKGADGSNVLPTDIAIKDAINNNASATRGALNTTYAAVSTPQRYGAIGDGVADDTAAVQSAVTEAANTGRPVTISGRFKVTAPIVLPTGRSISIVAAGYDHNAFNPIADSVASIESTGTAVFTAANTTSPVHLKLEGVNFRNLAGATGALFSAVKLEFSVIRDVSATAYGWIFKDSPLSIARVVDCNFQSVQVAVSNASITDSWVTGNYFNGFPAEKNADCFKGAVSTSVIANNYIDFFKRVFDYTAAGSTDVRIIGNTFDYCWQVIGTSTSKFISSLIMQGNSFHHCRAVDCASYFLAQDAEMQATPWVAVNFAEGVNRATITGNNFIHVETAFRIRGGAISELRIGDNTYEHTLPITKMDYEVVYYGNATDGRNIRIDEMDNVRVTTLPNPALTGGLYMYTYDMHRLIYNGVPVWNDAGTWRNSAGTAVT